MALPLRDHGAPASRWSNGPDTVSAGPQTLTYTQSGTLSGHSTAAAAFVPASAAPVLASVSPADNAINVAIGANLVANFSGPVVAGTYRNPWDLKIFF